MSKTVIEPRHLWGGLEDTDYIGMAAIKHGFFTMQAPLDVHLVAMEQTHSDVLAWVSFDGVSHDIQAVGVSSGQVYKAPMAGMGDHLNVQPLGSVATSVVVASDAVMTHQSNLTLSVRAADCLPIFLMGGGLISVIHAGRRGTLSNITLKCCQVFKALGVSLLRVWFGPAACVSCYEIDRSTRTHFDLVLENKQQIESVFFDKVHYFMPSGYCTECHHDAFYSYRSGDKKKRNVFYLTQGME